MSRPLKIAFIARSTLYSAPGGDTVQVEQTAHELNQMGVTAEVLLSNQPISYEKYDLLHFFNLIRPADILYHSRKAKKPFMVSTILCSYAEYDKYHRKGAARLLSFLPADGIEYVKTMARWLLGRDHLSSFAYTWKGQRSSIGEILGRAQMILPNSESEYLRIQENYGCTVKHMVVPNGVDPSLFTADPRIQRDDLLVLCAARIEGLKNQQNLILALNNTRFRLVIIGDHAPNQAAYYKHCRRIAAANVSFINHMPQHELAGYYLRAKVHVLPSWFETTGLSSIEAAVSGCNIVITDKGDTREYFADEAFYCNPGDPRSILDAVERASASPFREELRQNILNRYTWKQAAIQTLKAYKTVAIA